MSSAPAYGVSHVDDVVHSCAYPKPRHGFPLAYMLWSFVCFEARSINFIALR